VLQVRQIVPAVLTAVVLVAVLVIGYQVFTLSARLEAMEQRFGTVDQGFGNLDGRLGTVDQGLEGVDQRLGTIDEWLDELDERLDQMDRRLDAIATDARRAAEVFWPPPFPAGDPAQEVVTGVVGEPFDVSVDSNIMPMTSGRYTVLGFERLENDVEVNIRWEATVGPLNVSSFSWRGYDDVGNQYEAGYTFDDPEEFPPEGILAQGRQREGSIYLPGAAGANSLWIELIDFLGGGALAEVQLW
jgi:hypothetical protein